MEIHQLPTILDIVSCPNENESRHFLCGIMFGDGRNMTRLELESQGSKGLVTWKEMTWSHICQTPKKVTSA